MDSNSDQPNIERLGASVTVCLKHLMEKAEDDPQLAEALRDIGGWLLQAGQTRPPAAPPEVASPERPNEPLPELTPQAKFERRGAPLGSRRHKSPSTAGYDPDYYEDVIAEAFGLGTAGRPDQDLAAESWGLRSATFAAPTARRDTSPAVTPPPAVTATPRAVLSRSKTNPLAEESDVLEAGGDNTNGDTNNPVSSGPPDANQFTLLADALAAKADAVRLLLQGAAQEQLWSLEAKIDQKLGGLHWWFMRGGVEAVSGELEGCYRVAADSARAVALALTSELPQSDLLAALQLAAKAQSALHAAVVERRGVGSDWEQRRLFGACVSLAKAKQTFVTYLSKSEVFPSNDCALLATEIAALTEGWKSRKAQTTLVPNTLRRMHYHATLILRGSINPDHDWAKVAEAAQILLEAGSFRLDDKTLGVLEQLSNDPRVPEIIKPLLIQSNAVKSS